MSNGWKQIGILVLLAAVAAGAERLAREVTRRIGKPKRKG